MGIFDSVDDWFKDSLGGVSRKGAKGFNTRRDKARSSGSSSPSRRGGKASLVGRKARLANRASVKSKAPEVMVKITGSSKGLATARNHIDYISRNGAVELVDESGEVISGNRAVRDYKELLRIQQIPEESNKREFLHVIFSMPKNTPVDEMKEAVANFCKDEFSNRRYVMAFHDDTDHRHVHVCVGTRDIDRADEARLSPRKQDLRDWRMSFAAELRDVGIEAAASPRSVRFNEKKGRNFQVTQIDRASAKSSGEKSRPPSKVTTAAKHELSAALEKGVRPVNPAQVALEKSRDKVAGKWLEVLQADLSTQNAKGIGEVQKMLAEGEKAPSSRSQDAFDAAIKANVVELPKKPVKDTGHEF